MNPPPAPPRSGVPRRGQFPSWEGSGVGLWSTARWKEQDQRRQKVHIKGSQRIVHRHAPAARQSLALAHGPWFEHVEESERREDGQRQRPVVAIEEKSRRRQDAMPPEEFAHPYDETKRNGDNLVQHNRARVGPLQDSFRRAAEPDGQKNRGEHSAQAKPRITRQQQDGKPKQPDERAEGAGRKRNSSDAEPLSDPEDELGFHLLPDLAQPQRGWVLKFPGLV